MFDYLKDYFEEWNTWDWSWTIIATAVAVWLGLQWGEGGWRTWLSIITCLTGLWCVILVAKGRIFNYYVGIVNVVGYSYIAWGYQLWGEVMLNAAYFLPMQFVGLYIWMKNKDAAVPDKVRIKLMNKLQRLAWGVISISSVMIYGRILEKMGDPVPYLDSASTVLSIIAMILMAWRYMEQWILWIIVDIVSIWMWVLVLMNKGANDIAMLVMWSAYLVNACYGFYAWMKMYDEQCAIDMARKETENFLMGSL
jgi:nicotinamide mononucleotide transporter